MADTITVASALPTKPDGGDQVVLCEQDSAHPGDGWAFVAGPAPVEVGRTGAVETLLRAGTLVEVKGAAKAAKES